MPKDCIVLLYDPLDPILQLENRVHIACYLERHGDIEEAEKSLKLFVKKACQGPHHNAHIIESCLCGLPIYCLYWQLILCPPTQNSEKPLKRRPSQEHFQRKSVLEGAMQLLCWAFSGEGRSSGCFLKGELEYDS